MLRQIRCLKKTAIFVAATTSWSLHTSCPLLLQEQDDDRTTVINWSGTHQVSTAVYHEPESQKELQDLVKKAHETRQPLRVVGSALSPNGLGLSEQGMVNLVQCDRVLTIDQETKTVTVEAGARVSQVVAALRPHGLTLQNYASIAEQQIGGFIQAGAHGTGAGVPPVDMQVVSMKLVTPGRGTIHLSRRDDPALFELAKVGLGALGVVTEVTLQCVPAHRLEERTVVRSRSEVRQQHARWLQENQHIRYDYYYYRARPICIHICHQYCHE